MSRTNLVLLGLLVVVAGLWAVTKDWEKGKSTAPAPRLFPDFNKEAADAIEISGGWQGTTFRLAKRASGWVLASAGDYPLKGAEAANFIDAVYNLRQDNLLGSSADLQQRTHTDEENGRLVRVLRAGSPMAEFRVGKSPKRGFQEIFVRREDDPDVYRTRTILTKDQRKGAGGLGAAPPRGFEWHNYVNTLDQKWVETAIWDLGDADPVEFWLTRRGKLDVKLRKQAEDKWELLEPGEEPVAADADAAGAILDNVRRLSFYEVAGTYEAARKEYGLDEPEITLVMKLRKKVEKKDEGAPAPGDEGEEGADGEGGEKGEKKEEKPTEEYVTIDRIVEVGKEVVRKRYDSYDDKFAEDKYYAIRVGPGDGFDDPDEGKRTKYIFLVRDYKVGSLRKELADFKAKVEEKEPEKESGKEGDSELPPDDGGKKAAGDAGEKKAAGGDAGKDSPSSDASGKSEGPSGGGTEEEEASKEGEEPKAEEPKGEEPDREDPKGSGGSDQPDGGT